VIDYGIVNEDAWKKIEEFRIGERAQREQLETALRKRRGGKEQRTKGFFFGIAILFLEKTRRAK
jgi:hypothetical protein